MPKEQTINCSVFDCRYCNINLEKCELKAIKVASLSDDTSKLATMCDSYKKRN